MKKLKVVTLSLLTVLTMFLAACGRNVPVGETGESSKMDWWNESRFGMFIHWGLYSVLAGEWNGETNHAEWIRTTARIPLEVYDTLVNNFNPVEFNADEWVKMAKDAGMKYIVITSKHHDGFCLFDSEFTDFDVMSTPFRRDILGELATACRREGVVLCFYHSIMDWHNPDYLPRRDWEKDRTTEGADFERYIAYMKAQLKELTTKYGAVGVMWFDGEWEDTWNHERGVDLYNYVAGLQDGIIINNRVDKGRAGMQGMTTSSEYKGDFGTPEQEVPATGFPGVYWESCITLNNNWGYNKADNKWKSPDEVIRMLADIASKGGNLLLNIGPKPDGTFPEKSISILSEVGEWMRINSESVYGTSASPFRSLAWGRCTSKTTGKNTLLFLHVFDWPQNGKLIVPGLTNKVKKAYLLQDGTSFKYRREEADIVIEVPGIAPDKTNSVIVLAIKGQPVVYSAPEIAPASCDFVDSVVINPGEVPEGLQVLYTDDGSAPAPGSKVLSGEVTISGTTTIKTAFFSAGQRKSAVSENIYRKVTPVPGIEVAVEGEGLHFEYFRGEFDSMPDFSNMKPVSRGMISDVTIPVTADAEDFAVRYLGYINIPEDGMYTFILDSDDGSLMFLDGQKVIDNDGLHASLKKKAGVALGKGFHPVEIRFFQKKGGRNLSLEIEGTTGKISATSLLVH